MESPGGRMVGGVAGVLSVARHLLAVLIPWPDTRAGTSAGLVVVSGFPLLGLVFGYGLHGFVAEERDGGVNRLGFVFAVAAFTTLLGMIIVQQAVSAGIGEVTRGLDEATARALRRGLRLIDLGLDVAWDFLIGSALVLWGLALRRRTGFGPGGAVPLAALGVALIALNAATFPWPPGDRGLVDIGPLIALFWVAIAVRLMTLGRRAAR